MTASSRWKDLNDPRFNKLLERALNQALCEFENAPVVAAICDAGVPLWFMMSLAHAMQLDRTIRFYCDPHNRLVIARYEGAYGSSQSLGTPVLVQAGFKEAWRSGIGIDRLRQIMSGSVGPAWVAPAWIEPGPPREPVSMDGYFSPILGRFIPTKDATQ